ncbi:MAG: hypothetical protein RLZZ58_1458 [Pseudomonadota bacterium]
MNLPADPLFWITASTAIILLGLAKGGFAGLGATAMPLLALVMDPVAAAAMLMPILLLQDVVSVWSFRRDYDARTLAWMLPGAAVGIGIGWLLASSVSGDMVRAAVGVIALAFGLDRLQGLIRSSVRPPSALPQPFAALWGATAGFTSQIAHSGGPPFQIWALGRVQPHTRFVGTSSIFFAAINWMKLPAYWQLGQFTRDNMTLALAFLPLALASTFAGVWVVRRIDAARFMWVISLLMVVVGLELLHVGLT